MNSRGLTLTLTRRDRARAGGQRMQAVQRNDLNGLSQFLIELGHFFHFFRIGYKPRVHFFTALINGGDHQHHELHGFSHLVLFALHL